MCCLETLTYVEQSLAAKRYGSCSAADRIKAEISGRRASRSLRMGTERFAFARPRSNPAGSGSAAPCKNARATPLPRPSIMQTFPPMAPYSWSDLK